METLRGVLARDPRIAYALLFGSTARGTNHAGSDLDVAVGLRDGVALEPLAIGALVADLERAAGQPVHLVLLNEAPPALAYRVFRDGVTLVERERAALVARKVRAVLEYLDYKPLEDIAIRGVLAAAARGR